MDFTEIIEGFTTAFLVFPGVFIGIVMAVKMVQHYIVKSIT